MHKVFNVSGRVLAAIGVTVMLAAAVLYQPAAVAQPRDLREHERERYHTPHWVYDDRFHHDRFYPAIGYSVSILPTGNLGVNYRNGRYFFHAGVWYQQRGPSYYVVQPPLGIVSPALPPAYSTVWVAGVPYYYANDVYYTGVPGGYAVAQPPTNDMVQQAAPMPSGPMPSGPMPQAGGPMPQAGGPPPAPQAGISAPPAPAPQSSNWYYCESARGYYPTVPQCKEGWRAVPASPPPGR
jgi:hypothetical protein